MHYLNENPGGKCFFVMENKCDAKMIISYLFSLRIIHACVYLVCW